MDMFYDEAKSKIPHLPARRVHFHDFMAGVHQAIHDRYREEIWPLPLKCGG